MFNINKFSSQGLIRGGARPSLFDVSIFTPFSSVNEDRVSLHVSATSIPNSMLSQIDVYYFGRAIKLAGNRTFRNWEVEVLNDEDFAMRIMFENWSNRMNALISNRASADSLDTGYKSSALVTQYAQSGEVARRYEMQGLWPVDISPIRLNWQDGNSIETYTVEFSIDYWEPIGTGNADDYSGTISPDGQASSYLRGNR